MTLQIHNPLARACKRKVNQRLRKLEADGASADQSKKGFSAEYAILGRVAQFPFEEYPDYACPWHLITHNPMRWDHVHHTVALIEAFRQPTGSGMGHPMVLMPFQVMMLLCFLGPEDRVTGLRLVREGLLTLARKNGKTALTAAMTAALMCIHPDHRGYRGQEIQVGAADREQAGITFKMASNYINMDLEMNLQSKFRMVPSSKTMTHKGTATTLKCLSSDVHRAHGANPCLVILDEIGNVGNTQAQDFYSVLTSGFGAQEEPLTMLLSTQSPNDQHLFSSMVDRAKRINEGMTEDTSFAGFVYTVPDQDQDGKDVDPFDESLWHLANPGLGTICRVEDMRDAAKRARELPAQQQRFENLRLNRRVSEVSTFLSKNVWASNADSFDPEMLRGRSCYVGIDLSKTVDLTAVVTLFDPVTELHGRMPVLPYFWLPGRGLRERSRADHVPYDVWARDGLLDVTSERVIDYSKIARYLDDLMGRYDVRAIGFDRWKFNALKAELAAIGVDPYEDEEDPFFIPVGQGYKDQSRSVQILEELAVRSKLAHANHPILKWNVANAVVVTGDSAENRKFEKRKSYGRIDGCVALAIAAHVRADKILYNGDAASIYDNVANGEIFM